MGLNNREHTRYNFNLETWAKIRSEGQTPEDFGLYRLKDISRGGISFVTDSPEEFKRGKRIVVLEIEGTGKTRRLFGIVRYVNTSADAEGHFKVGCEFLAVS